MSRHPNTLCRTLAGKVIAFSNCITSGNAEWRDRHEADILELVKRFMPSGSGIDCGTKIDLDECLRVNGAKLFFTFSFHHMNEGGMYDGWTEHTLIVTPSLWHDFDLRITGRDRNGIKEYLHDVYSSALMQEVYQTEDGEWHEATDTNTSEPALVQPK